MHSSFHDSVFSRGKSSRSASHLLLFVTSAIKLTVGVGLGGFLVTIFLATGILAFGLPGNEWLKYQLTKHSDRPQLLTTSPTRQTPRLGQVLGANTSSGSLTISIPTIFKSAMTAAVLTIEGDSTLGDSLSVEGNSSFGSIITNGEVTFRDDVTGENINLDIGTGKLTASNVVYSVTAGSGISVSGTQNLTISSDLKSFKTIKVGSDTFDAGSTTDTLTFAASSGLTASIDTTNKKITFGANASALNVSGFVDDGTVVRLDTSTDNVGIGTASPTSKLEIASGTADSAGLTFTNLTSSSAVGSGGGKVLSVDSGGHVILVTDQTASSAEDVLPTTDSGGTLYFNGTTWVGSTNLYHDGGKVGISNTDPQARFHVYSNDAATKGAIIQGYSGQTANLLEIQNSSGTALSVFDENGNLGVGTASPTTLGGNGLEVRGTHGDIRLTSATHSWDLASINGGGFGIYDNSSSAYRLYISSGNVGIGTTDPQYKLDVNAASGNPLRIVNTDGKATLTMNAPSSTNHNVNFGTAGDNSYNPVINVYDNSSGQGLNLFYRHNNSHSLKLSSLGNIEAYYDGNEVMDIEYNASTHASGGGLKFEYGNRTSSYNDATYPATLEFSPKSQVGTITTLFLNSLGNVGIGTKNPTAPLHINTGFGSNAALIVNQLNSGDIFTASASGTTKFTIENGGDLNLRAAAATRAIKLTVPSGLSGTNTLDIQANGDTPTQGGRIQMSGVNASANASSVLVTVGASNISTSGLFNVLSYGGTGTATTRLAVTDAGKVGIGTTDPGAVLDIVGQASTKGLRITGNATGSPNVLEAVGSSASFVVSSSGAASTGSCFSIGSSTTCSNGQAYVLSGTTSRVGLRVDKASGTQTADVVQVNTNAGQSFTIDANGNVGIGTTSPTLGSGTRILEIAGGSASNADYGTLSFLNSVVSSGPTLGSIDFYGASNTLSTRLTGASRFSNSGTFALSLLNNTAALGSTATVLQFLTVDPNGSQVFTFGNANTTVNSSLGVYYSSSGSITKPLVLGNQGASVNGGVGIDFTASTSNGTSATLGTIAAQTTDKQTSSATGDLIFSTLNNSTTPTEAMRITGAGNVGIGASTFGTNAAKVFAIAGSTAPTTSITNGIQLWAEDVAGSHELRVRDEAGNVTTLSPHNFSLIPEGRSEELAWSFYSERGALAINADMTKALRLVEKLSGEKLLFIQNLETGEDIDPQFNQPSLDTQTLLATGEIPAVAKWSYLGWSFIGDVTFKAKARFEGSVEFVSDVFAMGRITHGDKDAGGFAVIEKDQQEVKVVFKKPFVQKPVVTVTPENFTGQHSLIDVSVTGFAIRLSSAAAQEVTFSWTALAVKDAEVTKSGAGAVPAPSVAPGATTQPSNTPTTEPTTSPVVAASPTPTPSLEPTPTASTSASSP